MSSTKDELNISKRKGSCGALLATARNSKDLSVRDVAAQLCLSVSRVEALESDNYGLLPMETFTRGYIKSYAQLVDLDPDLVLSFFPVEESMTKNSPELILERPAPIQKISLRWFKVFLILILIGMFIYIVWFLQKDPTVQASRAAVLGTQTKSSQTLEDSSGAEDIPTPTKQVVLNPNLDNNSFGSGESILQLDCSAAVWLDIRDKSGDKVFYRTCKGGEVITLGIDLPAAIFVGSIDRLDLKLDDKLVDLSSYSNSRIYSRFTLNAW